MFFGTGNGHVEQTALLFQSTRRIAHHTTGEKIFFQSHYEYVFKLQPLGRMNGHQRYLFSIIRFVRVLISKQGNLRKEICQRNIRVAFFLPQRAEIIHTIHQFLNVFLTTQILRRSILTDIIDDAGPADNIRSYLIRTLVCLIGHKAFYQFTETLQFGVRTFIDIQPIAQWFAKRRPKTDTIFSGSGDDFSNRRITDATGRIINDSLECFFIIRVHYQAEVSNDVLNLLTLVE